jgi:hypothetical protein
MVSGTRTGHGPAAVVAHAEHGGRPARGPRAGRGPAVAGTGHAGRVGLPAGHRPAVAEAGVGRGEWAAATGPGFVGRCPTGKAVAEAKGVTP